MGFYKIKPFHPFKMPESTKTCAVKTCSKQNQFHTISFCKCIVCLDCRVRQHKYSANTCPVCNTLINRVYASKDHQNYSDFRPRNSVYHKLYGLHILKSDEEEVLKQLIYLVKNLENGDVDSLKTKTKFEEKRVEKTNLVASSPEFRLMKTHEPVVYKPETTKMVSKKFSKIMNNKSNLSVEANFPSLGSSRNVPKIIKFQHKNLLKKPGTLDHLNKSGFEIKLRKFNK